MANILVYELYGKIYVNLTNRCTNECIFCLRQDKDDVCGQELWLDNENFDAIDVIKQFEKLINDSNKSEVIFCGYGEPLTKFEEVKKIGNNSSAIIDCLTKEENDDALNNSAELLEKLVETLLSSKKLNYNDLENYGQKLCSKDKKSALGNLALGLGLMNKKKPNLKRAMDCLAIAKSAKKPHPSASSAYYSCFFKRFGLYIFLGIGAVIVILIVLILKIKKSKKAAEVNQNTEENDDNANINLQQLLNEGLESDSNIDNSAELNQLDNVSLSQDNESNVDSKLSEFPKIQDKPIPEVKPAELDTLKSSDTSAKQVQDEQAATKPVDPVVSTNNSSTVSATNQTVDNSNELLSSAKYYDTTFIR